MIIIVCGFLNMTAFTLNNDNNASNMLYLPISTVYKGSYSKLSLIFLIIAMGNCLRTSISSSNKAAAALPIDTVFSLPSPLPAWPPGGGFATGEIDLGGLQLRQVTTFQKIWTAYTGGPDDLGATFLEPSAIPDGFSMLGSYAQPNNQPLFGSVLVAKTDASDQSGEILKQPTDYTLIAPSDPSSAYFWLPTPPDGYRAVGLVVTASPEKPPLEKIRCVRADFTDEAEAESSIWTNVYKLRPKTRGANAAALSAGTFAVQEIDDTTLALSCLMNKNSSPAAVPNQAQIEAVFRSYAPYIYFHPDETYLPSSVNWYFSNGALLYTRGDESNPVRVEPDGSNLPQGGSNDGGFWLDLPVGEEDRARVKIGDLRSAEVYLHVKPVLGGSGTDIQVWIFYPFNGPATAKLGLIDKIKLGKIGEHVGDWEHITLRISNFDGMLRRVYFAEHSRGRWLDSSVLEFAGGGGNRFVGYSSLSGHATYAAAGVVMQGGGDVGIRNDTAKSAMVMDAAAGFEVVAGEGAVEPPWLNYYRKWGPTRSYDIVEEVKKLPANLKKQLEKLMNALPAEIFGEDGPTGPKMKDYWDADER